MLRFSRSHTSSRNKSLLLSPFTSLVTDPVNVARTSILWHTHSFPQSLAHTHLHVPHHLYSSLAYTFNSALYQQIADIQKRKQIHSIHSNSIRFFSDIASNAKTTNSSAARNEVNKLNDHGGKTSPGNIEASMLDIMTEAEDNYEFSDEELDEMELSDSESDEIVGKVELNKEDKKNILTYLSHYARDSPVSASYIHKELGPIYLDHYHLYERDPIIPVPFVDTVDNTFKRFETVPPTSFETSSTFLKMIYERNPEVEKDRVEKLLETSNIFPHDPQLALAKEYIRMYKNDRDALEIDKIEIPEINEYSSGELEKSESDGNFKVSEIDEIENPEITGYPSDEQEELESIPHYILVTPGIYGKTNIYSPHHISALFGRYLSNQHQLKFVSQPNVQFPVEMYDEHFLNNRFVDSQTVEVRKEVEEAIIRGQTTTDILNNPLLDLSQNFPLVISPKASTKKSDSSLEQDGHSTEATNIVNSLPHILRILDVLYHQVERIEGEVTEKFCKRVEQFESLGEKLNHFVRQLLSAKYHSDPALYGHLKGILEERFPLPEDDVQNDQDDNSPKSRYRYNPERGKREGDKFIMRVMNKERPSIFDESLTTLRGDKDIMPQKNEDLISDFEKKISAIFMAASENNIIKNKPAKVNNRGGHNTREEMEVAEDATSDVDLMDEENINENDASHLSKDEKIDEHAVALAQVDVDGAVAAYKSVSEAYETFNTYYSQIQDLYKIMDLLNDATIHIPYLDMRNGFINAMKLDDDIYVNTVARMVVTAERIKSSLVSAEAKVKRAISSVPFLDNFISTEVSEIPPNYPLTAMQKGILKFDQGFWSQYNNASTFEKLQMFHTLLSKHVIENQNPEKDVEIQSNNANPTEQLLNSATSVAHNVPEGLNKILEEIEKYNVIKPALYPTTIIPLRAIKTACFTLKSLKKHLTFFEGALKHLQDVVAVPSTLQRQLSKFQSNLLVVSTGDTEALRYVLNYIRANSRTSIFDNMKAMQLIDEYTQDIDGSFHGAIDDYLKESLPQPLETNIYDISCTTTLTQKILASPEIFNAAISYLSNNTAQVNTHVSIPSTNGSFNPFGSFFLSISNGIKDSTKEIFPPDEDIIVAEEMEITDESDHEDLPRTVEIPKWEIPKPIREILSQDLLAFASDSVSVLAQPVGNPDELSKNNVRLSVLEPHCSSEKLGEIVNKYLQVHDDSVIQLIILTEDSNIPFGEFRITHGSATNGNSTVESIFTSLNDSDYDLENILKIRIGTSGLPSASVDHEVSVAEVEEFELNRALNNDDVDDNASSSLQSTTNEVVTSQLTTEHLIRLRKEVFPRIALAVQFILNRHSKYAMNFFNRPEQEVIEKQNLYDAMLAAANVKEIDSSTEGENGKVDSEKQVNHQLESNLQKSDEFESHEQKNEDNQEILNVKNVNETKTAQNDALKLLKEESETDNSREEAFNNLKSYVKSIADEDHTDDLTVNNEFGDVSNQVISDSEDINYQAEDISYQETSDSEEISYQESSDMEQLIQNMDDFIDEDSSEGEVLTPQSDSSTLPYYEFDESLLDPTSIQNAAEASMIKLANKELKDSQLGEEIQCISRDLRSTLESLVIQDMFASRQFNVLRAIMDNAKSLEKKANVDADTEGTDDNSNPGDDANDYELSSRYGLYFDQYDQNHDTDTIKEDHEKPSSHFSTEPQSTSSLIPKQLKRGVQPLPPRHDEF